MLSWQIAEIKYFLFYFSSHSFCFEKCFFKLFTLMIITMGNISVSVSQCDLRYCLWSNGCWRGKHLHSKLRQGQDVCFSYTDAHRQSPSH